MMTRAGPQPSTGTYQRVIVDAFGGPEVLKVIHQPITDPGPGECRLRVLAAGVAYVDIMMRKGMYPLGTPRPPFTPGHDLVGRVDAVGQGVTRWSPGDLVCALPKGGGYAQYVMLDADELYSVPEGLKPVEAVCMPLNYMTAYQMLHRFAGIEAGDRVLFHGASGGVGTALLQLGALMDLEMFGTASKEKLDLVQSFGATAIDYRQADFISAIRDHTPGGVDAVFDHIGAWHMVQSMRALRHGGRLIVYGEKAMIGERRFNHWAKISQDFLLRALDAVPGRKVIWYELDRDYGMIPERWYREDLEHLFELLRRGKISPLIHASLPLAEVRTAHGLYENSEVRGRVVLIGDGD